VSEYALRVSDWFEHFGWAAVDERSRLFTGAFPTDAGDVAVLDELGIEVIVNLCEDAEYADGARAEVETALSRVGIDEQRLGFTDFGGFSAAQVDAAVSEVLRQVGSGRRVYLHCRAGQQRSAAVATGALALLNDIELDDALDEIRRRKPDARPLEHQWVDLETWYRLRVGGSRSQSA
jgi:atypical dual specificity phosphatase